MSCIDAAIIRALVEHIGMDPDSVGSSSATTSVINATWSTIKTGEYDMLAFKLPEGQTPKLGMCLKLSLDYQLTGRSEITAYCTEITDDGELRFRFEDRTDVSSCSRDAEGKYVFESVALGLNLKAVPDNKTFGLFNITSLNEYMPISNYILNALVYLQSQIANLPNDLHTIRGDIMTLQSKVSNLESKA